MKTMLATLFSFCMLSVMAAGFSTDFTAPPGAKNWIRNSWKGYNPAPQFGYDAKNKCLHIDKPTSKFGFGLINRKQMFAAKAGDIIVVKYEVKGSGTGFVSVEYHDAKGKFLNAPDGKNIPLTEQWTKGEIELKIANTPGKEPTAKVKADLGLKKGAELFIRNISFEVKK